MIYSMTGYAARTLDVERGALHIELKSVNSRYLDFQFRICEELRVVEPALRELFSARLTRGKLECRLGFAAATSRAQPQTINSDLLERLKSFEDQVLGELPQAAPLSVAEVLRWPGMFGDDSLDIEALVPSCLALAKDALADFSESRAREGAKLAAVILERVERMRELVREVAPRIPAAQQAFQDKLKQRLVDAIGSADDERIRQEVAVFAVRIDVAEELARLSTHLDEVERVLKAGGASGKRLDFLMQELNREANTLGSKSVVTEVSQTAMELKLLILIGVFVIAYFKFTWSLRQFNLLTIALGAVPLVGTDAEMEKHARKFAAVNSCAGNDFNRGLRAYYFGMAVMAWMVSAWLFILSTFIIVFVMARREFASPVFKALSEFADD